MRMPSLPPAIPMLEQNARVPSRSAKSKLQILHAFHRRRRFSASHLAEVGGRVSPYSE
jgi:hypothetical protein